MANTLPGSPIVGFYNQYTKDFEEHNQTIKVLNGKLKFEDTTRPYGFIDVTCRFVVQRYIFFVISAILW